MGRWYAAVALVSGPSCFSPERLPDGVGDGDPTGVTSSTGGSLGTTGTPSTSAPDPGFESSGSDEAGPSTTTASSDTDTGSGCKDDEACDDGNPCTVDRCDASACVHAPITDEPSCLCESLDDCTQLPASDDCRTRQCEAGMCTLLFTEAGVPVGEAMQQFGDCAVIACDGRGGTVIDADNGDIPVDGLECTEDVCVGGVPGNPAVDSGTPCAAGECDGDGVCVGCSAPEDCGATTACLEATCTDGACGVAPRPADTPCPGGVCDGDGACVACNDASQCPTPGLCEQAQCIAHVCVESPADAGTGCDDGQFCTAVDACNGAGVCQGAGDPCPGGDGDGDCSESCNEVSDACDGPDTAGSPCNDGLFCTAVDVCNGAGSCSGGGDPCPGPDGDADCSESCSEAADACVGNDEAGTDCGPPCNVCTPNGACQVFQPGQCP